MCRDDDDHNDNDTDHRTGGPAQSLTVRILARGPDNFITFIAASIQ